MSQAELYIAITVTGREYVVLLGGKVVAGPFATAAEAIKAREKLAGERERARA